MQQAATGTKAEILTRELREGSARTVGEGDVARPAYSELLREIRQSGLLEPQARYYAVKMAAVGGGLAGGWVLFFIIGDSWLQAVTAAYLALVSVQAGIIAHDSGHMQIRRSRRAANIIGYIYMDAAIGLSFGWWMERHRKHHTYPNDPERDPDMVNGYVSFTAAQLLARNRWRGWLDRRQAYFVFPAMFLAQTLAMQISHTRRLLRSKHSDRIHEAWLLTAHAAFYLFAVIDVLSPVKAVVFIIINYGLFGTYLGGIIAPNHKGMEILDASRRSDFLIRQIHTSRNIKCGRILELFFGGLNYQIEHHLFPSMAAPCLRRAQPIVRAYCLRHGLRYCETGFAESYRQALSYLNLVGRAARPGRRNTCHQAASRH